jgi:acyl-CoA hydrolase
MVNRSGSLEEKIVSPERALETIKPGMTIFIGTGMAEPRTLVKHLMRSDASNLDDLELIQLVSLGGAISQKELSAQKYRLKTFFSGWVASEAILKGKIDLIPSRFSGIPRLIESRQIPTDVVFVQITAPNEAGYCSLGIAVDVARIAMEQASVVVGEINTRVPVTFGDTFVHFSEFDFLIRSSDDPTYVPRWPVDDILDQVAANVASVIDNGSCIAFSIGPLYEAVGRHLIHKRHLGIHSPFFTDPLMDLVKSGAVTNRQKENWRGKSVVSYAMGTEELMAWLNRNPLVEFQAIDKVFDPMQIGRNSRFVALLPARKVDLSGRIALHFGKGNMAAGPGEAMDFVNGAEISQGGRTIFALPSRNKRGWANIRVSIEEYPNQFSLRESVDMVVTEYGIANLRGRTLRERAQALIDIAHPGDRMKLMEKAKEKRLIYEDQVYMAECARLYPADISARRTFKNGIEIKFRAIRPSDEEGMRRLFYRFSDEAVYYRYFSYVKTMPHARMQGYVNVDCAQSISIVGLAGEPGQERIIAEARYIRDPTGPYANVAFVVDEKYQGLGVAAFLYQMLIRVAKKRGIQGFTAEVLASNKAMMKVFEKGELPVKAKLEQGVFELTIPFG